MNREQKIKHLAIKYFWRQKLDEVKAPLLVIFIIISFLFGGLFQLGWGHGCEYYANVYNYPNVSTSNYTIVNATILDTTALSSTCTTYYSSTYLPVWMMITGLVIDAIWVLIGLISLIQEIVWWFHSNWMTALKYANKEVSKNG